ncbi:MAG: hypothetical protein EBU49_02140 [Proteobacteria bacterium]|nr:hypothetical protein [Pseudomonadota bacterium]
MRRHSNLFVVIVTLIASTAIGCNISRSRVPNANLASGAPNIFEYEWSCSTNQHHFVNFGNKFEAAVAEYAQTNASTSSDSNPSNMVVADKYRGELASSFRGVSLASSWIGQLGPIFTQLSLPAGIKVESDCAKQSVNEAAYDACVEMVQHFETLKSVARIWDSNANGKKCYEGNGYQKTDVVEFAYCDNECAFNDRSCTRCEVPSSDGTPRAFVCKSRRSAMEAVGTFCRLKNGICSSFDPEKLCETKSGREFSPVGLPAIDGRTEHRGSFELSSFLGASESVQVKAGVVAGEKVAARGTLRGKIGYAAATLGSDVFTSNKITTPGTRVSCFLTINQIADVSYEANFGAGGDFLLANGEAVVEAGGGFNLNKEFSKTSATWSAGGQTEEMIMTQCGQNYARRWIANELTRHFDEAPELKIIQKAVQRVLLDSGLGKQFGLQDTASVFCRYPEYDAANYYRTAGVQMHVADEIKVQWGHMRHFGFDGLWPDAWSEKLPVHEESLRPFVRELKDGTLRNERLGRFFNEVVVPASQAAQDVRWKMDHCIVK